MYKNTSGDSYDGRPGNQRFRRSRLDDAVVVALAVMFVSGVFAAAAFGQNAPATAPISVPPAFISDQSLITSGLDANGAIRLVTDKSTVLTTARPCKRVNVPQPEVADFNLLSPTRILLTARKAGTTQLIVWDEQDHAQAVDVYVMQDVGPLREQYNRLFPNSHIEAVASGNSVILSGRVPNLSVASQAAAVAAPYAPKVVNLLEVAGGQQVMLQVRFAEVSRSATSSLGVNFGFTEGHSFFGSNVGQVNPLGVIFENQNAFLGAQNTNPAVTVFGRGEAGNAVFLYFLDALRQNNLLRILAEPNLVAISGEDASFLAGGEYPIPITQGGGAGNGSTAITIEYRQYGVKLNFTPVVVGDGTIRLTCSPEVSDLDFSTAVTLNGFVVPGLLTRRLTTTIELADGQSFILAGLLNNSVLANKSVVPLLGDIPILGTLFSSTRYQRRETELMVIVTPRLVSPLNPSAIPLLPGEQWRHPTEAELFLKQDLGGPTTQPAPQGPPRRFYGESGFVPATQPSPDASKPS